MGKSKKAKTQMPVESEQASQHPAQIWLLYGMVALAIIGVVAGLLLHRHQQDAVSRAQSLAEKQRRETIASSNFAQGLPETYPADFVPLYPGVEVLEATAADATADDGTPMSKWHVLSQTDAAKGDVYRYYLARLQEEDLRQTMYISLPTGYSLSYADENRIVELRIEKMRADPKLQVELTVYVTKGQPASKVPYDPARGQAVNKIPAAPAPEPAPAPPTSSQPK